MKALLLSLVVFAYACSHSGKSSKNSIPAFDAQKVCSTQSFAYFQKTTDRPAMDKNVSWKAEIAKLQPLIRACYQAEMERRPNPNGFNVCLIADYDAKGNQKYFDFSTQEVTMSPELTVCLNSLSGKMNPENMKDTTIVQPVKLYID